MSNIYFTSDTHYGHTNIAGKSVSKWKEGYRHYNSVKEMNDDLVKGINKTVKEDEVLFHLGDWSFGGIDNVWNFRKQLRCRHIHLILGNHDHHIEENTVLPNCIFSEPFGGIVVDGDPKQYGVLKPGDGEYPNYVQAQRLFSSVSHYKEVKTSAGIFVLSHYGHRVWHGSHKGWIHLYGHSHDSLPPYGKSMDIGIDTAIRMFGDPRPFSLPEIIDFANQLPLEFPDHHDLTTNTGKPQGSKRR